MAISVFDLLKIGIGPSSSHTVGPMRAALRFATGLAESGQLTQTARIQAELYGSLGATGRGHGSDKAVLLGLQGEAPDQVDTATVPAKLEAIRATHSLNLLGRHQIAFTEADDLLFHKRASLPYHPNGMRFTAFAASGAELRNRVYYSVGGGFVVNEEAAGSDRIVPDQTTLPYEFKSAKRLLELCAENNISISRLMLENEKSWRTGPEIRASLLNIWQVMQQCVRAGCTTEGTLSGGLKVRRRAAQLHRQLSSQPEAALRDPLTIMDWVNLYALAVNEENAAGGRVVTAPTNGAAGIIPAVLHYYIRLMANRRGQ